MVYTKYEFLRPTFTMQLVPREQVNRNADGGDATRRHVLSFSSGGQGALWDHLLGLKG